MLLAIETGYEACSVALIDGDTVVAQRHAIIGRGHAERLVPTIEAVLHRQPQPDAIAVDIGPGSFTGLRVGIAAARGLGLAWRVPVTGFRSTALVAAAALQKQPGTAAISVVMDAGRGEVFMESFDAKLRSLAPVAALAPPAAAEAAMAKIAGTAAKVVLAQRPTLCIVADVPPDAADVRLLPAAQRAAPATPLYVRAPDAKLPAA
jgi:tRNA threonylcarbamoyl adenosine modification protein YeaZ